MALSLRAVFITVDKDGEEMVAMSRAYPTVELRHRRLCTLHGMPYAGVNIPELAKQVTAARADEDPEGFVRRFGDVFPVAVLRKTYAIKEKPMVVVFVAIPLVSHLSPTGDRPLPLAGSFSLLEELASVLYAAKFDFDKVLSFIARTCPLGTPPRMESGLAGIVGNAAAAGAGSLATHHHASSSAKSGKHGSAHQQPDHHVTVTQVEILSGDLLAADAVCSVWGRVLAQREGVPATAAPSGPASLAGSVGSSGGGLSQAHGTITTPPTSAPLNHSGHPPGMDLVGSGGAGGEGATAAGGFKVSIKGKLSDIAIGGCVSRMELSAREGDELDLFVSAARRVEIFSPPVAPSARMARPQPELPQLPPGATLFSYTAPGPTGSGPHHLPDTPSNLSATGKSHGSNGTPATAATTPMIRGSLRVSSTATTAAAALPNASMNPAGTAGGTTAGAAADASASMLSLAAADRMANDASRSFAALDATMTSLPGGGAGGDLERTLSDLAAAAAGGGGGSMLNASMVAKPVVETTLNVNLQLALNAAVSPAFRKSSQTALDIEVVLCFGWGVVCKSHTLTATTGVVKGAPPRRPGEAHARHIIWKLGKLKKTSDAAYTLTGRVVVVPQRGADSGGDAAPPEQQPFVNETRCFAEVNVNAVGYTTHSKVEVALSTPASSAETTALTLAPPVITAHELRIWNAKALEVAAARLP